MTELWFCISIVLASFLAQWNFQVDGCQVEVEKVGCFADKTRPFKELLINRRNTLADEELSVSLPRLLCDCAVLAESRGYTYIGLQYYAECWSNEEPVLDYGRDGTSEKCYNKVYEKCEDGDTECVGDSFTNYVYKIKAKSVPESTIPGNEQTKSPITLAKTLPSMSPTKLPSTSATLLSMPPPTSPSTSATLLSMSPTKLPSTSATLLSMPPPTSPSTSASATTLPSTSASPTTGPVMTKPSSTVPPKKPCQDKNPQCNANRGYCNSAYPAMLEQCPKTCGVCK